MVTGAGQGVTGAGQGVGAGSEETAGHALKHESFGACQNMGEGTRGSGARCLAQVVVSTNKLNSTLIYCCNSALYSMKDGLVAYLLVHTSPSPLCVLSNLYIAGRGASAHLAPVPSGVMVNRGRKATSGITTLSAPLPSSTPC